MSKVNYKALMYKNLPVHVCERTALSLHSMKKKHCIMLLLWNAFFVSVTPNVMQIRFENIHFFYHLKDYFPDSSGHETASFLFYFSINNSGLNWEQWSSLSFIFLWLISKLQDESSMSSFSNFLVHPLLLRLNTLPWFVPLMTLWFVRSPFFF